MMPYADFGKSIADSIFAFNKKWHGTNNVSDSIICLLICDRCLIVNFFHSGAW